MYRTLPPSPGLPYGSIEAAHLDSMPQNEASAFELFCSQLSTTVVAGDGVSRHNQRKGGGHGLFKKEVLFKSQMTGVAGTGGGGGGGGGGGK